MIRVDVDFSDATPLWTCECQQRFFGDAVVDAFRNWWKHVGQDHPEAFND